MTAKYLNWVVRIVSFGIAFFLWYYVYHNLNRSTQNVILGIKFINRNSALYTGFNFTNKKIVVTIEGKKDDVKEVVNNIGHIKCFVDLSKSKAGLRKYKINFEKNTEIKTLLTKVDISFNKHFFAINFESFIKKKVAIKLGKIKGPFGKDLKLIKHSYSPKYITIRGPRSKLSKVSFIQTKDYVLSKESILGNSVKDTVKLKALSSNIKNISKAKEVSIHLILKSIIKTLTLKRVGIVPMESAFSNLVLKEKKLSLDFITYKGSISRIEEIEKKGAKAYINISPFALPGRYTVNIFPEEMEEVSIVDYAPKKVRVTLVKKVE